MCFQLTVPRKLWHSLFSLFIYGFSAWTCGDNFSEHFICTLNVYPEKVFHAHAHTDTYFNVSDVAI